MPEHFLEDGTRFRLFVDSKRRTCAEMHRSFRAPLLRLVLIFDKDNVLPLFPVEETQTPRVPGDPHKNGSFRYTLGIRARDLPREGELRNIRGPTTATNGGFFLAVQRRQRSSRLGRQHTSCDGHGLPVVHTAACEGS